MSARVPDDARRLEWVMVIFGLIAAWGFFRWSESDRNLYSKSLRIPGQVVKHVTRAQNGHAMYYPIVEYRHPQTRAPVRFEHFGSTTDEFRHGETVNVIVNEEDPAQAMVGKSTRARYLAWAATAFALLIAAFGLKGLRA